MAEQLYFEDWGATYGSPYLVDDDLVVEDAQLVQDAEPFCIKPDATAVTNLAFVDGVRRIEGLVYLRATDGAFVRGAVGAHAAGAVVIAADATPELTRVQTRRLVVMGQGRPVGLGAVNGYSWNSYAISSSDPEAPVQDLQRRMRESEAALAEELSRVGWLTIVDGPLNFVRSLDQPVVGYVKTHLRRRLPVGLHARVPELGVGQRTPLFVTRQSYSAYVRIAAAGRHASPWSGIVRIEVPESQGLAKARERADGVTIALPRFAGVPHKDPRAPQNLLPIGALERQLRHQLGPADRASRAVRLAVAATASDPATP